MIRLLLLISSLFSFLSIAADQGDIYVEASSGFLIRYSQVFQGGMVIGYVPTNEVGVGLVFDQLIGLNENASVSSGFHVGVEGRWFLEPFELSGSLGYYDVLLNDSLEKSQPLLSAGLSYLFALTPSLAGFANARLMLPLGLAEENGLFLGLGLRLLY